MKKPFFLILFLALVWSFQLAAQNPADKVCGTWISADGKSHIEIYPQDGKYFGKVVWLKEPNDESGQPKKDIHNSNSYLAQRPILGLVVIANLKYKKGTWEDGKLYAPEKGKTLNCELELLSNDELEMTVSQGFISKSRTLKRLK